MRIPIDSRSPGEISGIVYMIQIYRVGKMMDDQTRYRILTTKSILLDTNLDNII